MKPFYKRFCKICGLDIDISSDKYLYIPLHGFRLWWQKLHIDLEC